MIPSAHPEIATYQRLNEKKVSCVATALAGGDVGGHEAQLTVTQDYLPPEDSDFPLCHSRIVLKEIGVPLEAYPNSAELITFVYQALIGTYHIQALSNN